MKGQWKGTVTLLLAAFIWGTAFVAQSIGLNYIGVFTFQAIRCLIGGAVLLPVIGVMQVERKRAAAQKREALAPENKKLLWLGGVLCGVMLCVASNFQQAALVNVSSGKAGFVTALYILIVPLLGLLFRKKVPLRIWGCVAMGLVGLYLLCVTGNDGAFSITVEDLYLLACAFAFSVHIMTVDYFAPRVDGTKLSCIQFFVCAAISAVLMLFFEKPAVGPILDAAFPLFYAGAMSCGVAYTFQIIGQKYASATVASLIMSLESVFALLAGMVVLQEFPSRREALGCILMFVAILWSQLPQGSLAAVLRKKPSAAAGDPLDAKK